MATSTSKKQRIGIWVIAIVLTIGSVGSFFVMILANNNNQQDQVAQQKQKTVCDKELATYQNNLTVQGDKLSSQYYSTLAAYTGQISAFDAANIKSVSSTDLTAGNGETIGAKTQYDAYYIGWTPDGKIFDQSISGGKLKAPIPGSGLIQGWTDGVKGMKVGGVREITISSDEAYGTQGNGSSIPPNTPIKFVILAIPTPPTVGGLSATCTALIEEQQQLQQQQAQGQQAQQ